MVSRDAALRILDTGIVVGPFKTSHYRKMVTPEFKRAFLEHVVADVVPQLTIDFTVAEGKLVSHFDAPNFLGPQSAVRHRFHLFCNFIRKGVYEDVYVGFDYDPASNRFRTLKTSAVIRTLDKKNPSRWWRIETPTEDLKPNPKGAAEFRRQWQHRWFGCFLPERAGNRAVYEDFFDPDWGPDDKDRLVKYLNEAPECLRLMTQEKLYCCFCDANLGHPGVSLSDNEWLWPKALGHYVEHHGLTLPDNLVAHIQAKKYKPPKSITVDIEDLEWPYERPGFSEA